MDFQHLNLILLLVVFAIQLLLKLPIIYAIMGSCLFYFGFLSSVPPMMLLHRMTGALQDFTLIALPLYVLAAEIMNNGRITEVIFDFFKVLLGHITGSLGHVNIAASMIFAGMSGSITADTAGLGKIEIPSMTKEGYDKNFAAAVTGASSLIGPIIPPSLHFIGYGMIASVSVGRLFMGGAIPGFLMGFAMMITVYIIAKKYNYTKSKQRASFSEIWISFKKAFPGLMTPIIILGTIALGIFSPTEAAVVAVIYSAIISVFVYKAIKFKDILPLIANTAKTTSLIGLIIGVATVFGWIVTVEKLPLLLTNLITGITSQPLAVLLLLMLGFLIAGCFFDIAALLIVITPMVIPLVQSVGIDLVHFGVVIVLTLCIGFLTPPFGVGLFILTGITDLSIGELSRAMIPFYITVGIVAVMIAVFPQLVLYLPNLVFGS